MQTYVEILNKLKERFPEELIKYREGPKKKVGNEWKEQQFAYIPTDYLHERLDLVLGLNWNWEILGNSSIKFQKQTKQKQYRQDGSNKYDLIDIVKEVEQVVVWGRLVIKVDENTFSFRDSFGGCDVGYGSQAGDSFKIADSNAFKKACYKFGIGRYLGLEGLETDSLTEENFNKPKDLSNVKKSFLSSQVNTPVKKSSNPFAK